MRVGECCNREVVIAEAGSDIRAIARLMREHHVGDVVVVRRDAGAVKPVGIVTDRDLVVGVLAADADAGALTAGDVMGARRLFTAAEGDDLDATLERMRDLGIRRAPVVDARGALVGILTLDDVLDLAAETMTRMAQLVRRELRQEAEARR